MFILCSLNVKAPLQSSVSSFVVFYLIAMGSENLIEHFYYHRSVGHYLSHPEQNYCYMLYLQTSLYGFFLLNVLTTNNFSYNFTAYITEVHCKSQNTPAFLLRKRGLVPNKEVTTKAMEAQEIRASNNCYREMVEVLRRKSLIFTFTILFSTHFRILNCHNVQLQHTKWSSCIMAASLRLCYTFLSKEPFQGLIWREHLQAK